MKMDDCLPIIAQYLPAYVSVRLCKEFSSRYFPTKLVLKTSRNVNQFIAWCSRFDTSNLVELYYTVSDMDPIRPSVIGWAPSSVTKMTLDGPAWWLPKIAAYMIPSTVVDLHLNHYQPCMLPTSVKKLTLGPTFKVLACWPPQIEELIILGWGISKDTLYFEKIFSIPNTVRSIHIGKGVNIEIIQWPTSLTHLSLPVDFCKHAPVPDHVVRIWN